MKPRWHVVGTELVDPREMPVDAGRRADIAWVDDLGLVAAPGSEWLLDRLRLLDGGKVGLGPVGVTPVIDVDLSDHASAYWAMTSILWHFETEGQVPRPTWVDRTPPGAVN